MTSPQQLKREVEMLQNVLQVEPSRKAEEIIGLLKKHEQLAAGLTAEEDSRLAHEVVEDLKQKGIL